MWKSTGDMELMGHSRRFQEIPGCSRRKLGIPSHQHGSSQWLSLDQRLPLEPRNDPYQHRYAAAEPTNDNGTRLIAKWLDLEVLRDVSLVCIIILRSLILSVSVTNLVLRSTNSIQDPSRSNITTHQPTINHHHQLINQQSQLIPGSLIEQPNPANTDHPPTNLQATNHIQLVYPYYSWLLHVTTA